MNPEPPQTAELIGTARRGDRGAFGELVRLHEGWLRAFLRARLRDWASADDLAQESFITAYLRLKHLQDDSAFEPWLRGIAVNHLRNHIRKKRELHVGGTEDLQPLCDEVFWGGEDTSREGPRMDALRTCLGRITGPSRELLAQRYTVGKSVREIAAESGRGYSALSMQFHRLRENLANCIRQEQEGGEA
ncbi:RNA polymerase sigma factor [Haloferula rosea]|uniref:RNA polymerase sigma factor n=1 Tax=Haloferula rosea TaxID=490093 RepID=A0A934R8I2_9BACT|nr:sigma-70 family RNA polymerase sigma factor [Haloferula rosea]MBK1825865.1 sigma-70 family RNA polymerase sigma factor [Haloferula rosea]